MGVGYPVPVQKNMGGGVIPSITVSFKDGNVLMGTLPTPAVGESIK